MIKKELSNTTTRIELKDVNKYLSIREGYEKYRKDIEIASNYNYVDRPTYVVIEVNNYCNMRCKMCVKSMYNDENGKDSMDMGLFNKLINDCAECKVPSYFLGGGTECTINPNINEIINIIRKNGKGIDDVLITNGYELTEELSRKLVELQWEKVFVSIDAAYSETYKKIRGKNLEIVEHNVEKLIEIRNNAKSTFPIIRVSFVIQEDNEFEREDFYEKWKDKVEIIDFQKLLDLKDREIKKNLPDTEKKCVSPFKLLMVGCDGQIYPCCNEFGKRMPIGNIKNMTIKEAWNSTKMNKLRTSITEGKLSDICKTCLESIKTV